MKLGGRQSTNVDDIRKQKPKSRVGEYAFPASEGFNGPLALKVTESRKKVKSIKQDLSGIAKKAGIDGMTADAGNRMRKQLDDEMMSKSTDEMTVDELVARSERKAKEASKSKEYNFDEANLPKWKRKPTQLKEIWTPRPLNSKK